jgi:hypothetical protein
MIKDAYNNTLSSIVNSVIPANPDTIIIKNLSLDGRPHLQTIGTPVEKVTVSCMSTYAELVNLTDAAAKCVPIQVDFDGGYYDGIIDGNPGSGLFNRGPKASRLYQVTFEMFVTEQG